MKIHKVKQTHRKLNNAKARLIGHLIGDGCVYQSKTNYNIKYQVIDEDLLDQFENDFIEIYGLTPMKGTKQSGKTKRMVPFIHIRSKKAFMDLLRYCDSYYSNQWRVPSQIMNATKKIQKEFLKALYDDEGSVIPTRKTAELRLYSINYEGLIQIEELLQNFNISTRMRGGYGMKRNVYAIITKDLQVFHKKIGFHCARKQEKLRKYMKGSENAHFPSSPPSRI